MPSFCERKKHENQCNKQPIQYVCTDCNEKFDSASLLLAHEDEMGHNQPGTSGSSSSHTSSLQASRNTEHQQQQEQQQNNPDKTKKVKCSICKTVFPNRSALFEHKTIHRDLDSLQPVPWNERPIWEDENGTIDYNLKKTYEQHKHVILRSNKNINQVDIKRVYNFPLNEDFSLDDLLRHIETIYITIQITPLN